MEDNPEQARKKTDECKVALTNELDTYTLSRFWPSASGRSAQFLATNRKSFYRKQMRLIVNDYFNKEETDELSQQAAFTNQSLPRTLADYRKLLKKTDECKSALFYELDMYIQSRFRGSANGRSAQFFANLQSFHREQMLLIIDEYFDSEESADPTLPSSTAVTSVNQLDITSKQGVASFAQVVTASANPPIPVSLGDQQQGANSGEVQVKEVPIGEDSSTRPREVDNPNTTENTANVSTTEQDQSDREPDSDCGCDDGLADKGRVQADSVMISPQCNNSDVVAFPPNRDIVFIQSEIVSECESEFEFDTEDYNLDLTTTGHVSEMTNNQEIDEDINSLLNQEEDQLEEDQVEESVAQMQTDAQQQASVPTAVNSSNEQVDNSVTSNFEILNDSQAMEFNDDAVDEQANFQAILDEAFVDEAFPTVDLISLPSTSSGRQSIRSKKKVNYAVVDEDSVDEYLAINRNGKRTIPRASKLSTPKRVAVEPVVAADEEEVDVEAVGLSVIVHHLNCPEAGCTEECKDKAQLNGHLFTKHQIKEFRCKVKDCALSFTTLSQLTDHRKSAHRKLKNLSCSQCETTRKNYNQLCTHFASYHEEGEFHCSADKCDFTANFRIEVYSHQHKHRPRKHSCTFAHCTASFKLKSNLTVHLRAHNQEKPFACDQCPKAFTKKSTLTVHQRIHSGLKPYRCTWPGCDYSASDRSHVNKHVRIHHFGLPASKKEQAKRRIIDTRDAREFVEKIPAN